MGLVRVIISNGWSGKGSSGLRVGVHVIKGSQHQQEVCQGYGSLCLDGSVWTGEGLISLYVRLLAVWSEIDEEIQRYL